MRAVMVGDFDISNLYAITVLDTLLHEQRPAACLKKEKRLIIILNRRQSKQNGLAVAD